MRDSFAYSTIWMGDIAAETADGRLLVDVAAFLTRDEIGIAQALKERRRRRVPPGPRAQRRRSQFGPRLPATISSSKARLTFTSAAPTAEVDNIAPVERQSELRRPPFADPPARARLSAAPLRSARRHVRQPGGRFRASRSAGRSSTSSPTASGSSRLDPDAPRSRVRRPIIFYIDRAAPEPIRTALLRGRRLVARGVRGGRLYRRLPGRAAARGRRPARRPLQCRPLGQPRHPRLVLRPGDRGSAHRRDHPRPGAAGLAAGAPGHADLRRRWSAPARPTAAAPTIRSAPRSPASASSPRTRSATRSASPTISRPAPRAAIR